MININNIKLNFIGDIKFKWLNDYDMYKSFINAIKKCRIPSFIAENSIENFEHIDGLLYTVTMIPEWSLHITVLERYINPDIKANNWNIIAVYPENNRLKLSIMFDNFNNEKYEQ